MATKPTQKKAIKLAEECLKEIGIYRPFRLLPYAYKCRQCGKEIHCTRLPEDPICTSCALKS